MYEIYKNNTSIYYCYLNYLINATPPPLRRKGSAPVRGRGPVYGSLKLIKYNVYFWKICFKSMKNNI